MHCCCADCANAVNLGFAPGEVWFDAAERMGRFAAADLLREVCAWRFGSVEAAVAAGLALRYDGGSCVRSDHYQTEIDHLGIRGWREVSFGKAG